MATYTVLPDRVKLFFANWTALLDNPDEGVPGKDTPIFAVFTGQNARDCALNERQAAVIQSIMPNQHGALVQGVLALFKRGDAPADNKLCLVAAPGVTLNIEGESSSSEGLIEIHNSTDCSIPEAVTTFIGGQAVGTAPKEFPSNSGGFADAAKALLEGATDAAFAIGLCLRVKDHAAIQSVKKGALLLNLVLGKTAIPSLETLPPTANTPQPNVQTKEAFSGAMNELLKNPTDIPGLQGLRDGADFKSSLTFVAQSGGQYSTDMKNSTPGEGPLTADCVLYAGGHANNGYSAYCARTFFFPERTGEGMVDAYNFAVSLHDKLAEIARPGVTYTQVAQQVEAYAKELSPELAQYLDLSDFGHSVGLTILEGKSKITASNTQLSILQNSTLVLRLAMNGIPVRNGFKLEGEVKKEEEDEKKEEDVKGNSIDKCAIHIADTYLIDENHNIQLTKAKKTIDDCCLRPEPPIEEEEDKYDQGGEEPTEYIKVETRGATGKGSVAVGQIAKRNELLKEILAQRHADWVATNGKSNEGGAEEDITATELGRLVHGDFGPFNVPKPVLTVDPATKTVWLPVAGAVTPFHIATIQKSEIKGGCLVVTFFAALETNVAFRQNRTKVFLKEVTVNPGADANALVTCQQRISEVIAAIKTSDTQRKQKHGVAADGNLQINRRGDLPRLIKVKCKPPPVAGKHGCVGDLEAHDNGFRFNYGGGPPVQIMYNNVKHLIFQPAQNDPACVFHVTLKQPILLGGKKHEEISFQADVIDQSEGVRNFKKSHEEEIAADEAEHARIQRTNQEFALFCKKADAGPFKANGIGVSVALERFEFTANTGRAMVKFKGNATALFALNEPPFWTQNFKEVEVVSLERVYPGTSNFDVKFIHKGYRKVTELAQVPASHLEDLKTFLVIRGRQLIFESQTPLNWTQLLKVIRDDKDWEPYGPGGWETYMEGDDDDDEDEDGEDDDSDDFDSDDSDDDDDDDSDDSSWAEEVSTSEDLSSEESDSDESWDAQERKAEEADRRNRGGDDSDDDAPKRKKARKEPPKAPNRPPAGAPRPAPGFKGGAPGMKMAPKAPMGVKRPGMPAMPPQRR